MNWLTTLFAGPKSSTRSNRKRKARPRSFFLETVEQRILLTGSAPVLSQSTYTLDVDEAEPFAFVGQTPATDVDNDIGNFSLSGTGSTLFDIDMSGNIYVNSTALDYETTPSYTLTVTVTDMNSNIDTATVTINVNDVAEDPVLSQSTYTFYVDEAEPFAYVDSVSATDPQNDISNYSLSGTGSTLFDIDTSGNIYVNSTALDYETTPVYYLTVTVTDMDGHYDTASVTINVNDVAEDPAFDKEEYFFFVVESATMGYTVGEISATDPQNDIYSYSLSGTGSGDFSIDTSGVITVATSLDAETKDYYVLTATVTDMDGHEGFALVKIFVLDVGEGAGEGTGEDDLTPDGNNAVCGCSNPNGSRTEPTENTAIGDQYGNVGIRTAFFTSEDQANVGVEEGVYREQDGGPGVMYLLAYDSVANPHPIVEVEFVVPDATSAPGGVSGNPLRLEATLTFGGLVQETQEIELTSGVFGERVRLGLQADATSLATGRYDYQVVLKFIWEHESEEEIPRYLTMQGSTQIINNIDSEYGNRWWLPILDRLVIDDDDTGTDGVVLVRGAGSTAWYEEDSPGSFLTPSGGRRETLSLDPMSGEYQLTFPDGKVQLFDADGLMLSITDPNGNETTFGYDVSDRLTTVTFHDGKEITYAYHVSTGLLTSITDQAGRVYTVTHDGEGRVTGITAPDPDTGDADPAPEMEFGYDATTYLLTSMTDAEANETTFDYGSDDDRRINSVTTTEGTWNFESAQAQVLNTLVLVDEVGSIVTDPEGNITKRKLDRLGYVQELTVDGVSASSPITYERNADGKITRITHADPDGGGPLTAAETNYTYDGAGRLLEIEYDDSTTATWTYAVGTDPNPLTYINQLNKTTTYTYDAYGNVETITDAIGHVTEFTYDGEGRVLTVTEVDPEGTGLSTDLVTTYEYDTNDTNPSFGRLLQLTYADGTYTKYVYTFDGGGLLLEQLEVEFYDDQDNLLSTTTTEYDQLGRTTQVTTTDPDGGGPLTAAVTKYTYDNLSRVIEVEDALGNKTAYEYDAQGNVTKETAPDPTTGTATGAETVYEYYANGWLKQVTTPDPDGIGPLTSSVTEYEYFDDGNLKTVTDPLGKETHYTYDGLGRLKTVTTPDPDGGGAQAAAVTTYAYDQMGRLKSVTDPEGFVTSYTYDAAGRQQTVTTPDPDGAGSTYGVAVTTYVYDDVGRLIEVVAPNATTGAASGTRLRTVYEYNDVGWLKREYQTDGTDTLNEVSYTYDTLGRMLTRTEKLDGSTSYTTEQEYDPAGNLVSITDPLNNETESTYDELGRLLTVTDALGNVTAFGYDKLNRVVSVTDARGQETTYTYDKAGRLTAETTPFIDWTTAIRDSFQDANGTGPGSHTMDLGTGWSFGVGTDASIEDGKLRLDPSGSPDAVSVLTDTAETDGRLSLDFRVDSAGTATTQELEVYFRYQDSTHFWRLVIVLSSNAWRLEKVNGTASTVASGTGTWDEDTDYHLDIELDGSRIDISGLIQTSVTDSYLSTETEVGVGATANGGSALVDIDNFEFATPDAVQNLTTNYTYDDLGQLLSVTDPLGNVTSYTYDKLGRKTSVIDAAGFVQSWSYDNAGRLIARTDALGQTTQYAYDDNDRLTEVTTPAPAAIHFRDTFTDANSTVATAHQSDVGADWSAVNGSDAEIQDQRLELTPDGTGSSNDQWLLADTGATEGVFSLNFRVDTSGSATTEQIMVFFRYQDNQNYWQLLLDASADTWTLRHRNSGGFTTVASGSVTLNVNTTYTVTIELGQNATDEVKVKLGGSTLATTTSSYLNAEATIGLGANAVAGTILAQFDNVQFLGTAGAPRTITYGYDNTGNVTTVTDGESNTVTSTYDQIGRLIERGDGTTSEEWAYNVLNQLTAHTDIHSLKTVYAYDALNRVESVTRQDDTDTDRQQATYTYNGNHQLLTTTLPDDADGMNPGAVWTNAYDDLGRLVSLTNPDSDAVTYEYDERGQLVRQTDELGRATRFLYDDLGRRIASIAPLGNVTRSAYDANGQLTSTTNPLGQTTAYTYDSLGHTLTVTDAESGVTTYRYNPNGQLLSLTDSEDNLTSWVYDTLGQQVSETNQLGDTRSWQYNDAGNLIGYVDRNGRYTEYTREFSYNGADNYRLTTEEWFATAASGTALNTITYIYDADNFLSSVADDYSDYDYTYDELGRLETISNANTPNQPTTVLTYSYDDLNRVVELAATLNGTNDFINTYTYDDLDRVTRIQQEGGSGSSNITDKRLDFAYNAAGQQTTISRYEDLTATTLVAASAYVFDRAGRLLTLDHTQGVTDLNNYAWSYDTHGNITQMTSVDGSSDYTYDATQQLTDVDNDFQADESHSYDANGNRTDSGYTTGDNNQVTSDGTYNYEYDAEGNITKRTHVSSGAYVQYEFDHRNRLTKITFRTSGHVKTKELFYAYDVWNRLIERQLDSNGNGTIDVEEYYVYADNDKSDGVTNARLDDLIFALDDGGSLTTRYLHGPGVDQPLAAEDDTGNVLWLLADHQGTIRDLADMTSTTTSVVNHIQYDAFGTITAQSNPSVTTHYGYTARVWDADAGLYYFRARWYDSSLGRFISQDPIGFAAGDANLMRTMENSGVNGYDPSGLFKSPQHRKITEEALKNSGLSKKALSDIIKANIDQDDGWLPNRGAFKDPTNHGDNNKLGETIDKIYDWIDRIQNLKYRTPGEAEYALELLGKIFHALQDLYAHSTYVEHMDGQLGGVRSPSDIPLWILCDEKGNPLVPPGVISGTYNWWEDDAPSPSHKELNKDDPESPRGKTPNPRGLTYYSIAENRAISHTAVMFAYIINGIPEPAKSRLLEQIIEPPKQPTR